MNNWCVYKHTFPDGRIYIGITSDEPEKRWNNGFGYENQRRFFKAIVAAGWNNVKHEVVADGLDERMAQKEEKKLVAAAAQELGVSRAKWYRIVKENA